MQYIKENQNTLYEEMMLNCTLSINLMNDHMVIKEYCEVVIDKVINKDKVKKIKG